VRLSKERIPERRNPLSLVFGSKYRPTRFPPGKYSTLQKSGKGRQPDGQPVAHLFRTAIAPCSPHFMRKMGFMYRIRKGRYLRTFKGCFWDLILGSFHKRHKAQAPIRNRQTRNVANAKVLNRNTNLT